MNLSTKYETILTTDGIIKMTASDTPKTSLNLTAYRKKEESDFFEYDYKLTHTVTLSYQQRVNRKISIGLNLRYSYENYAGEVNIGGESKKRKDDLYDLNPSIRYHFSDRFYMHFGYTLEQRDSTIRPNDFSTNTLLIGLTLEL